MGRRGGVGQLSRVGAHQLLRLGPARRASPRPGILRARHPEGRHRESGQPEQPVTGVGQLSAAQPGAGQPLRGRTVAITADRRREEQAVLLQRLGAEVQMLPLLRTEPAVHRDELRAVTEALVSCPPGYLVATTGYGVQAWFELAELWGLREALVTTLRSRALIAARGAKALGALRKAGLEPGYKAPGGSLGEVVGWLLEHDLDGATVALQLPGDVAGAPSPVPSRLAQERGALPALLAAFNSGGVVAACIGPVCAAAATDVGIVAPLVPEHPRLGSLATALGNFFSSFPLCPTGASSASGPLKADRTTS